MTRAPGPTFREWLSGFNDNDGPLGELARELDSAKPLGRGQWSVGRYERHLVGQGAGDEVIDALQDAWERHRIERQASGTSEKAPKRRARRDTITVVLTTGTTAKTEVVDRDEFRRRMAGSPAADRYDGKRYAVLRPSELRTWRATADSGYASWPA